MEIKDYSDEHLNNEIENYEERIETLKQAIEFNDDSFTKSSIQDALNQYVNFYRLLKSEKNQRTITNSNSVNEQDISNIVNAILENNKARAIFFKDSIPGKMHFEALYQEHMDELNIKPFKVYQLYLPFDLSNNLISKNPKNISIDNFQLILSDSLKTKVFISLVKPDKGRNAFDRNTNQEVSNYLELDKIDLWQGVMFYFFV